MSKDSKAKMIGEIGELARVGGLITDRYDEAVCEALGVNRTDLRVLDVLERIGPLPAGKLAREAGLSPGAMTASIDRLESAGHARRVRDRSDRRRITVEITPSARKRAWEMYGPWNEGFERVLAGYSLRDLELIRDYWQRGIASAERQLARLDRGDRTAQQ
jgi:DNA-binding MarR family transcriptional regulator